jgi:hypothetical protein
VTRASAGTRRSRPIWTDSTAPELTSAYMTVRPTPRRSAACSTVSTNGNGAESESALAGKRSLTPSSVMIKRSSHSGGTSRQGVLPRRSSGAATRSFRRSPRAERRAKPCTAREGGPAAPGTQVRVWVRLIVEVLQKRAPADASFGSDRNAVEQAGLRIFSVAPIHWDRAGRRRLRGRRLR